MDIKIEGNPGTGNSYTEVHIDTVQNYNPNATTIINNNHGTRVKSQGPSDGVGVDKERIRFKIVAYVKKTIERVSIEWKNRFESLWQDILKLREVDAEVYNRGGQQGTDFNRVLVAGIIHVLMDAKVYVESTYTSLALLLENNNEHHVRQELAKYPSDEIQKAVKRLLNPYMDTCSDNSSLSDIIENKEEITAIFQGAFIESGKFEYTDVEGKLQHGIISEAVTGDAIIRMIRTYAGSECRLQIIRRTVNYSDGQQKEVVELTGIKDV